MALPDSYTVKPGSIPVYFEAILNAEAPERFTTRFLTSLEFKSTNDRLFIGVLKDLGFIDADGVPKQRYYEFLDRSQSPRVLAEAIRESYSDLFSINKEAHKLSSEEVRNKLRTLYAGSKKTALINRIASTFNALCDYADFSAPVKKHKESEPAEEKQEKKETKEPAVDLSKQAKAVKGVSLDSLQYHINIVLPESRDQAVYDAIFKALKEHLG